MAILYVTNSFYCRPILKGEELICRLQGLEYMNDDPGAVDVLYAKLQPGDMAEK